MANKRWPAALLAMSICTGLATTGPLHAAEAGPDGYGDVSMQRVGHHATIASPARADTPVRLGVGVAAFTQQQLTDLAIEYGVRVAQVAAGSAAERAGVETGDIITGVDGRPVYSPERLQFLVAAAAETSRLAVMREGKSLLLTAELQQPPAEASAGRAMLGVRIQDMTPDLREAFGAEAESGVLISQVIDGSGAQQAGLKAGDVLVSVGGSTVAGTREVLDAVGRFTPGDTLAVTVMRDHEPTTVELALGTAKRDTTPRDGMPRGHGKDMGKGYHGWHDHHGMQPKRGCHGGWVPHHS